MMRFTHVYTILFIFISTGLCQAQSRRAQENEGNDYLNNREYAKAYSIFDKLHKKYPKSAEYHFKLGIASLNDPGKTARAIEIFQALHQETKTTEAEFYLGSAYHVNYRFDEAVATLQPLVDALSTSTKKADKDMMKNAQMIIAHCENGRELSHQKSPLTVLNLGNPINTSEIEGVPVITADESIMIFTYQGKKSMGGKMDMDLLPDHNGVYTSDIYITVRDSNGKWQAPVPVKALNTKANEAAIAISPDGHTLFTFMSTRDNEGDIYVSHLKGTEFSAPVPLNANINSEAWEGSCSISSDGKLLYFSSERAGGLGGKDIWVSKMENGDWGVPVNLGNKINTPYDEDSPFIHPDGITLFFSSKGHNSMGGYDIMYSIKQDGTGEWSEPKNMGTPVNTTSDDNCYVINSQGNEGYFSSDRAAEGSQGSHDIYLVNPGVADEILIVALYKGIIYGDNQPIEARIDITRLSDNENFWPFYSNKASGKYLIAFRPKAKYHMTVSAEGFTSFEEDVDFEKLSEYYEIQHDIYLYSQPYLTANPDKIKISAPKVLIPSAVTNTAVMLGDVKKEVSQKSEEVSPKSEVASQQQAIGNKQQAKETSPKSEVVSQQQATTSNKQRETETKEQETEQQATGNKQQATAKQKTSSEKPEAKEKETNQKSQVASQQQVTTSNKQQETEQRETEQQEIAQQETNNEKTEETSSKSEVASQQKATGNKQQEKETSPKSEVASQQQTTSNKQQATTKQENETKNTEQKNASPCDNTLPDLSEVKGKSLNDAEVYKKLMSLAGNYCADGVVFKVQIGAYRKPENFKYPNLKSLGEVETLAGADGITRFTQKQFNTLKEAETHRQKVIAKGQKDAWIVAFINGERYSLEDFIMLDFMGKAIN